MKKLLTIAAIVGLGLSASACTVGKEKTRGILESEGGYTDLTIKGHAWFGCSKGDDATQAFEGTKNGYRVHGVVCGHIAPWGKAPTIRIQSTKKL
jgi:flagellar hook protein FlgE